MSKEKMLFTDSLGGVSAAKDPAVVKFSGRYIMYYSVMPAVSNPSAGWGIGIAESHDLIHWDILGRVTPEGELEAKGICAPGATVYDGKVHIFYQTYGGFQNDAICHAYSSDGIHFIRNKTNPIVRAKGDWNIGRAIDADVCIFEGELYLYFATRNLNGNIQLLGVSKCPLDGKFERNSWEQCCDEAILKPELEWEKECIEAAATLVRNGKVYMFYGGAFNNSPQQIGVAVSEDAVHFTRLFEEPFLKNGEWGSWNFCESGHPYIFEDEDGKTYLFYQGNNDWGKSWYLSMVEIGFEDGIPYIID